MCTVYLNDVTEFLIDSLKCFFSIKDHAEIEILDGVQYPALAIDPSKSLYKVHFPIDSSMTHTTECPLNKPIVLILLPIIHCLPRFPSVGALKPSQGCHKTDHISTP